jgi:hypothetical protein
MQTRNQLLVLIVPLEIKDEVVDCLMALDFISGFNLNMINGYSRIHSQYDVSEQVEGHRRLYRFEVLHKGEEEEPILNAIKASCSKDQVRYWVMPVNSQGHF